MTLMTLHASKGLEFPCVYLVAVEEGLLPHERSRGAAEQLEEERRLMFVGITRAQQRLQISLAEYRDFRGERKPAIPSSFLMELPRGEMEVHQPEAARVVEIDDMPVDHEPVFRHDEPSGAGVSPAFSVYLRRRASESASETLHRDARLGFVLRATADRGGDVAPKRRTTGSRSRRVPARDGRFAY